MYSGTDGIHIIKEEIQIAKGGLKDTKTGEFIATLKEEDFTIISKIGKGASAAVYKARHDPSETTYAIKSINIFDQAKRKQFVMDLKSLYKNMCPFLVQFYGAYYDEGSVKVVLEYMELGSIGSVLSLLKPHYKLKDRSMIPEPILSKIMQ
jgi:mitogen-activated protein kinase kinase 3